MLNKILNNNSVPWLFVFLTCIFLSHKTKAAIFDCTSNPTNSICFSPDQTCLSNSNPVGGLMDSSVQDYIVALHNVNRARVATGAELRGAPGPQPPSNCMGKLSWSADLALAAQRWADQCRLMSDTNRNRNITGTDDYVGQNVFGFVDPVGTQISSGRYPEVEYWRQAIESWFNEVTNFNSSTVSTYNFLPTTGHYTQVVWGRTINIGCGFRRWFRADGSFARILICNYWPGGNLVGDIIYQTPTSATPPPNCGATNTCRATTLAGRRINGNGRLCE